MRLDHLLSTENSGHGSCPVCAPCAWNGSTVPCGDAGVEEIVGLPFPWGWREWYGCAFGFPDRRTAGFPVVRFDAHAEWPASVGRVAERVARGGLRTG